MYTQSALKKYTSTPYFYSSADHTETLKWKDLWKTQQVCLLWPKETQMYVKVEKCIELHLLPDAPSPVSLSQ